TSPNTGRIHVMENDQQTQTKQANPKIQWAILLGLFLLAVDFTTKTVADTQLALDVRVPTAIPFLSWRLAYNTGSHYLLGSIGDYVPYRLVMGIAAIGVVGLTAYTMREIYRMAATPFRTVQWFLVAFLIGALGNAIEVVLRGRATDFFMIRPFPWPANLCDQFVNIAVFVLLPISIFLGWRDANRPEQPV
ncbi:MAG: signal peptidase II, partial [Anaerolineales bacterium]|nr:signal peptidase II [Anaerolineales bacterium]